MILNEPVLYTEGKMDESILNGSGCITAMRSDVRVFENLSKKHNLRNLFHSRNNVDYDLSLLQNH